MSAAHYPQHMSRVRDALARYRDLTKPYEATGMASLLVRCPIFGREFSVGVETDAASLALIPEARAQAQCPYCGIEHQWSTRDARLSETGAPAKRVAAEG